MSADDNAPEQAREVRAVLHALRTVDVLIDGRRPCGCGEEIGTRAHEAHRAQAAVHALAPFRAAERQEALIEAAEDEGWFDPTNLQHHVEGFRDGVRAIQWLRDRADGMAGQSNERGDDDEES